MHGESLRLCEFLYQSVSASNFKPMFLELSFGYDQKYEINVLDQTFEIVGKVDRVDVCDNMFTVIDYKSGTTPKANFGEVYYGEKIQLPVYLNVLEKVLKKRGCGIYYLPIRNNFEKDEAAKYQLVGKSLKDGIFDNKFENPVGLTEKSVFQNIKTYSLDISKVFLGEILQGNITPSPLSGTCEKCPYFALCGKNSQLYKRNKQRLSAKNFSDEEDKE